MNTRRWLTGIAALGLLCLATLNADTPKVRIDAFGDALPVQATHRFGTARFCTQVEVTSLALSADGKLLVAADRDGRAYVWDAGTGKERLRTAAGIGKRVALSRDGQWLAIGDEYAFEVRNLVLNDEPRLQIGGGPRVFTFSPDSKTLATSQGDQADVVVYDLAGGKELRRFAGLEGAIAAVAFSPDGKAFAAATAPAADAEMPAAHVVVWEAATGAKRKEWDFAAKQVQGLAFLPDNKTLVGQFGARLAGWDATSGDRLPKINQTVGSAFAFDDTGKLLASTNGPKIVEFPSGKELHEFESPALIRRLALAGNGTLLAASPARFDLASPRILLWDLATGKERAFPAGHQHYVDAVAYSHDGRMIATASNAEGVALVWDAKTTNLLHTLKLNSLAAKHSGGPLNRSTLLDGLAFSADRPELYIAGQRWDLKSGEPIPLKADDDFRFDQANSYRVVTTPDARHAASFLSDHSILFWDPATVKTVQKIEYEEKDRGRWFAFAFTADGQRAATGKWFPLRPQDDDTPLEDTVHLWDVIKGKRLKSMRRSNWPVIRLMLSPDAETLAVIGFPAKLELWHLPTGRLLREMILADLEEKPRTISLPVVTFAPHGQWLALAHKDGEIELLETLSGKKIQTLAGHRGDVTGLAFSPDGRHLVSGGRDTTALLWDIRPERPDLPESWRDADKLWHELGGPTEQAYRVVWALTSQPGKAFEVLSKRLQPDSGATEKEIQELITNLSSAKFGQRDAAMRRLKEIGTRSLPALEHSLKKAPNLETARRIQELLKTVEKTLTPEALRDVRALQVLELIGSPQARQLLAMVARGDAGAAKTRSAQAALERLKKTDAPR